MLVIRLFRVGKKNQPFFKIVVTDKKSKPKAGRFVEEVGFYNPLTKEKNLKTERIKYWFSVGAKPSETIHNLLVSEKIIEGKKIPLHKKSKKEKPAQDSAKAGEPVSSVGKEKPAEEESKEEFIPVSAETPEAVPADEPSFAKASEAKPAIEEKPAPPETPSTETPPVETLKKETPSITQSAESEKSTPNAE